MIKRILVIIIGIVMVLSILSLLWGVSNFSVQDEVYYSDEDIAKQGDSYTYTIRKGAILV